MDSVVEIPAAATSQRWRIQINGTVQGVGFRPFVYRLARALHLTGWVCNNPRGVLIEAQGDGLPEFVTQLVQSAPRLARIDQIHHMAISCSAISEDFQILSSCDGAVQTRITVDSSICAQCLRELFDPHSRFYQYPFINCSDCGPRYTLTAELPYDRANTCMKKFIWCVSCRADYQCTDNRRYHTESINCADCGPQYVITVANMARLIAHGNILAVKALGGYQLICDAMQVNVVRTLRRRKRRPEKPLALMMLNIASVAQFAMIDDVTVDILTHSARPIVLVRKKNSNLPDIIAPQLADVGVMLPSTPLHYLMFYHLLHQPIGENWLTQPCAIVLVVTSANISGEPLIKDNDEAIEKLAQLSDKVVGHSCDILAHADDSVISVVKKQLLFIRRARGYVPEPITLASDVPSMLGLGGHLKNTFCITRGKEAFVSQHIGNLTNTFGIRCYQSTLKQWLKLLNVKPSVVVHDFHPDFYTTQIADQFGVPVYAVQHHHAHLAGVAAEHHCIEPALGLALDGFGLGENQQHWGGELFWYQGAALQRLASLRPLAQPGGERATREPWRMAISVLYELGLTAEINNRFGDMTKCQMLVNLLAHKIQCPLTSSCGRLFDAASALLGVCRQSSYEGQAAMQLEALVTQPQILPGGWIIRDQQLDLLPVLRELLNCDRVTGANIFHGTLAAALTELILRSAKILRINKILLSGGCFLNRVLTDLLLTQLTAAGLTPLLPQRLPPNDGGLSLGQIWAASLQKKC